MEDLSKYEIVDGECNQCALYSFSEIGECRVVFRWIAGYYCYDKVLKKKEVESRTETWETCTKENTKVGDIVIDTVDGGEEKYEVICFHDKEYTQSDCVVYNIKRCIIIPTYLSDFKIQVD